MGNWCCHHKSTSLQRMDSFFSCTDEHYPDATYSARSGATSSQKPLYSTVEKTIKTPWWAPGDPEFGSVGRDMRADSRRTLSKLIDVRCVKTSLSFSSITGIKDSNVFPILSTPSNNQYVIYRMLLGPIEILSLHQLSSPSREINQQTLSDLANEFKLITSPVNFPISLPLQGPKSAETLSEYFGEEETIIDIDLMNNNVSLISVNIYAKWIIRHTLPTLAFSLGRVCDFFIVNYTKTTIICSLRIICTNQFLEIIK
jgi:hypothetical protein